MIEWWAGMWEVENFWIAFPTGEKAYIEQDIPNKCVLYFMG